jgi:hypothetical protein
MDSEKKAKRYVKDEKFKIAETKEKATKSQTEMEQIDILADIILAALLNQKQYNDEIK